MDIALNYSRLQIVCVLFTFFFDESISKGVTATSSAAHGAANNRRKLCNSLGCEGFSGREVRHEGIFIFAIVLLVLSILIIVIICLMPWYCRRRREKEQAQFAQFSMTEGVSICEHDSMEKGTIIRRDIAGYRGEEQAKPKEYILVTDSDT